MPASQLKIISVKHHYWRLRDGQVTYFRGSEDTELTAEVFAA